ncbi:MAG: hypothetical protein ACFFBD_23365 [Candidatus Hodarchaeota archaeon]
MSPSKERDPSIQKIIDDLGIKREDFEFVELKIDHSICRLGECRLCLEHCPTNALYQSDKVELIPDLCIACAGCILLCMVPKCMKLTRIRKVTGQKEVLQTTTEVKNLINAQNSKKRQKILQEAYKKRKEDFRPDS